jgi:hypothetical protein
VSFVDTVSESILSRNGMFSLNAPSLTEIAPDVFRIGLYAAAIDL